MADTIWKKNTPLHVKERVYSDWKPCFAYLPVITQQGETAWFKTVYYREVHHPSWFTGELPYLQYSLIKKGYWEQ